MAFVKQSEKQLSPWWKPFLGPLVAALLAGASSMIAVQREMASLAVSVDKMTVSIDKITDEQTNFFKGFYVPLALKVEQQGAAINSLNVNVTNLKDEMRYIHSPKGRAANGRDGSVW